MHAEWQKGELLVSTDPSKLSVDAVHSHLARSYWAEGIPREVVEASMRHSLCFGLFDRGAQVGFARVITDYGTFAYMCDVYVLENHRGRGLGQWLVECVLAHPQLQGLRHFQLATRDAHGLYRRFGFEQPKRPESYMELRKPDVYKTGGTGGESAGYLAA
jgi:ribosomal protein S18 acetylase RimI-like enzyme